MAEPNDSLKSHEWHDLKDEEAYRMTMAEFKGMVMQALKDIKDDVQDVKQKQDNLQNQLNNQKLIAAIIGGFGGIITSLIGVKKL